MKISELIIHLAEILKEENRDIDVNYMVDMNTTSEITKVEYDKSHGGDGVVLS